MYVIIANKEKNPWQKKSAVTKNFAQVSAVRH